MVICDPLTYIKLTQTHEKNLKNSTPIFMYCDNLLTEKNN